MVDAIEKVTGRALYGTDVKFAGMLYGKVLRSPFPHARILHVDTRCAERLPGVKAIATGKDLRATYGTCIQDQPYYCFDKVRYVGDPVAGVAAVDEDTAEEALGLIKVEYEELPAVFDPLIAMSSDAPLVHENLAKYWHTPSCFPIEGTNICNHFKLRRGDVEQGFKEADDVIEDTFSVPAVQHCQMEPPVSVVQVDISGKITIWTSNTHPHSCLRELAKSLELPMNQIRVISTYVGGSFGAKTFLKVEPLCYVLASKLKHRPVKIILTREEAFSATSVVRHPAIITVKSGVKKDGTLTARKVKIVLDTGAYADMGPLVAIWAGVASPGPYKVPHIWTDSFCVYTNRSIAGAFRGFGTPQTMWAVESHMDILAEKVGMDPAEFRLKNALEEGSISSTGQVLHGVGIKECIEEVTSALKWKGKEGKRGWGKGIGLAQEIVMSLTTSSSFVKMNEDGTAEVQISSVDMGQGSNTVLTQIAAEELGLNVEDVRVVKADTDYTPFDHGTSSSRTTFYMGNALKAAAADAKRQLLEAAADLLEANPLDLEIHQGVIYVKGSPDRNIPVKDVPKGGKYLTGKGKPILGRGTFTIPDATPLDRETGQGANIAAFWMYAAQAAEVEVDEETGKVKVLKIVSAHDVGKAINPAACEQQIEGALGMGVGTALMEEIKLENGKTMNPNFTDYKLPTSLDMPEMVPIMVETIHEQGPYGAKGLGEPALAPTAPAIANAIYNAVGVRIKDLPITPDKVLKALKEKR